MKTLSSKTFTAVLLLALTIGAAPSSHATTIFSVSTGIQPSNVGTVTLTQVDFDTVNVTVDLLSGYGFLNTGGPHTPFAFNLSGSEAGLSASFITPTAGTYAFGVFSLSTADGGNSPFGTYGVSIENSAGNGSSKAYFGDLSFDLTRAGGLTEASFIANTPEGYYFSADLTNGQNTGAQAWKTQSRQVPDSGATVALLGLGLGVIGFVASRRTAA